MTVIAYDGKTLAGDKQSSWGTITATTTKVFEVEDSSGKKFLIGGAGDTSVCRDRIEWVKGGRIKKDYPKDEHTTTLVIAENGQMLVYEATSTPIYIENSSWAIGTGAEYAIASMYLGKTAKEAVEIANLFCPSCGNGVDVVEFSKRPTVDKGKPRGRRK